MSAILPRSKQSGVKPISQTSTESCKGGSKKRYAEPSAGRPARNQAAVASPAHHVRSWRWRAVIRPFNIHVPGITVHSCVQPWSGLLSAVLRPFPPDVRYNIERALGGIGEALSNLLPKAGEQVSACQLATAACLCSADAQ